MPIFGVPKPADQMKKAAAPRKQPERKPVTKAMCEGLVGLVQFGWQSSPWRETAMDETEQLALVNSLYQLARGNVWIGNLIYATMTASGSASFGLVVGAMVVSRLALRGTLPIPAGIAAQVLIARVAGEDPDVETGGARRTDRADRDGQNDTTGGLVQSPPVRRDVSDEIGYVSLAEMDARGVGRGDV